MCMCVHVHAYYVLICVCVCMYMYMHLSTCTSMCEFECVSISCSLSYTNTCTWSSPLTTPPPPSQRSCIPVLLPQHISSSHIPNTPVALALLPSSFTLSPPSAPPPITGSVDLNSGTTSGFILSCRKHYLEQENVLNFIHMNVGTQRVHTIIQTHTYMYTHTLYMHMRMHIYIYTQ